MVLFRMLAALALLSTSAGAFADTDCNDPIADWKPRELLRQVVEQRGWTLQRIKVDDGCYEIRALDRKGNKIKAKYAPASLRMRSLAIEFGPDGDAADYGVPAPALPVRPQPLLPAPKGNNP